jgi:protein TonB
MKGEEPVAVWVSRIGSGLEERDYNFELNYGKRDCENTGVQTKNADFLTDNAADQYTAPVLDTSEADLMTIIRKNLRYPAYARRNGVDGTVQMIFTITKEGRVENIVVIKGLHVSLDKEAVRMVRLLKFKKPPVVKGEPADVCVKFPITYKLN